MEYASNGKANAGLTLGIIGTSLAGLLSGMGNGSGLNFFGGNNNSCQATISALESEIAELKAMRYTDSVGQDLYKSIVAVAKEESERINAVIGLYILAVADTRYGRYIQFSPFCDIFQDHGFQK